MLPMDGTSNPTMIRSIVELYSWLNSIMTNSICFCSATMKVALEILQRNQTDCVAAPSCRMLLPVSLTGTTSKKKWESGGTSLPCSLEPISSETEAAVLHSLILELNNKLGLKLDPLPDLSRVVDVGGSTGPPQVLVVGASNAARTADALERAGADVLHAILPGWRCLRQKAVAMAELVRTVMLTAKPKCVVVLQIFDTSFHFARTEDGGLVPACRSADDARFHVHGESVVAPKESQFSAFSVSKEIMLAAAKHQLIIISPLPRYLYNRCCADKEHCSNFSDSDYRDSTEAAILACRRNLKDFAFRHGLRGCKILCPWSTLKKHAEQLWSTDPVHMTREGYDLLEGLVLEAAMGAEDMDNRKRTLDMPEARPGLSKKRLS